MNSFESFILAAMGAATLCGLMFIVFNLNSYLRTRVEESRARARYFRGLADINDELIDELTDAKESKEC